MSVKILQHALSKKVKCSNSGILSAAGSTTNGYVSTAEIFNPRTGQSCKIGDISTICINMVCGGETRTKSCYKFDGDGTFKTMSVTLIEPRRRHLCCLGDMIVMLE